MSEELNVVLDDLGFPPGRAAEPDPLVDIDETALTQDKISRAVVVDGGEIEESPRVKAALELRISDQQSLNRAGALLNANRILQVAARRLFNWTEIKRKIQESKDLILRQEHSIMDPLVRESEILARKTSAYLQEQDRLEQARLAQERREREEAIEAQRREQERLRRVEEDRVNALQLEQHADQVERLLDTLPADTPLIEVEIIANAPAPDPVRIPAGPVVAPIRPASAGTMLPRGMSATPKYKGELFDLAGEKEALRKFLTALLEERVPMAWVIIDYPAIARYANAVKPEGFQVPGMRCVRDFTISQRRK